MFKPMLTRSFVMVLIVVGISLFGALQTVWAHSWYPDDKCIVGPNAGYFFAAGPEEYWVVDRSSGWNGCHLRTFNTSDTIINFGNWYLPLDNPNYNHYYAVSPYVQSSRTDLTGNAHYRAWGNGHGDGNDYNITANFYLDQNSNRSGYCYQLGSTWI